MVVSPAIAPVPFKIAGSTQGLQPAHSVARQAQPDSSASSSFPGSVVSEPGKPEAAVQPLSKSESGADAKTEAANKTELKQKKAELKGAEAELQRKDEAILQQLKARDREVRLHEAAHKAVGGQYAGAMSLQYKRGPDGVQYAVAGEVAIDISPIAGDPEATIQKARQVRAAALAPAEPSGQDRMVAAEAARMETQARAELQKQNRPTANTASENESANKAADTITVDSAKPEAKVDETEKKTAAKPAKEVADENKPTAISNSKARNARERLEEMLLTIGALPQQLNQAGLVDAQHPHGKSGFMSYIV